MVWGAMCSVLWLMLMVAALAVLARDIRQLQERFANEESAHRALDGQIRKLARRVERVEERLDVLHAPQTAADLAVVRRMLGEILEHLTENEETDRWWRQGDPPPW